MKINNKYYKEISIALILSIMIIIVTNKKDFTLEYTNELEKVEKLEQEIETKKKDIIEVTSDKLKDYKNKEMEKLSGKKLEKDELKKKESKLSKQVHDKEKELEKIEKEKIKKEEEKKRKEEDKKREDEAKRRAGSWILESDGYNIWEAFLRPGTYSLRVTHDGDANIIGYLGDKNNPEGKLLINEIGAGNFGATFNIPVEGYYTLTFIHDGAIEFKYQEL